MDVDLAARRVANYIKSMTEEAKMLAQLAGHDDIRKFSQRTSVHLTPTRQPSLV